MTSHPTRRRMLQLTGVGATASLAGCSQFNLSGNGDTDELEADEEPDIDPADGITAIVQPSQEELAEIEQEIMAEIEAGEIDQQDAQMVFQERQEELFVSRAIEFESSVADADDISIAAAIGERGAFLLEASDERLIDTLRDSEVDALLPGEEYEEMRQAQEQAGAEPQPEPDPDDEGSTDDGDADDDEETDDGDADDDEETDDGDE